MDLAWLSEVCSDRGWRPQHCGESSILGPIEDGVIVVDTETDGLYPHLGHRPFLIGLATLSGRIATVWVDDEAKMAEVRRLMADSRILKVGHHFKFDIKMMRKAAAPIKGPVVCTMLLTQLANNQLNSYRLKQLAVNLLGEKVMEEAAVVAWMRTENRRRKTMERKYGVPYVECTYKDLPPELVVPYLEKDLEYTAKLLCAAGPKVARMCAPTARVEMRLLRIVARMEWRGVYASAEHFRKMSKVADVDMDFLQKEAWKYAGQEFDLQSSKSLSKILFEVLGLECLAYTDKGNPKFDSETLPMYDHPVVKCVLARRKRGKLKSTYYDPLAAMALQTGGTVHSSFNQLGAKRTGRFSSSDPNLQNCPRKDKTVRAGFVCRPGFVNFYLDYSQIEMRIFAHYAKARDLLQAFADDVDTHEQTAVLLFGEEARGNDQLRFVGKTINFGVIYGMGARALRKQLRKRLLEELEHMDPENKPSQHVVDIANINETGARALLSKYYKIYPSVHPFMEAVQHELYRTGQIVDVFGRPYRVPISESYKGINYLVQGTAAGVLKRAMIRIDDALRSDRKLWTRDGACGHIVNCVHDELQVEVPESIANDDTARRLRDIMEDRKTFVLPITCDVAVSRTSWAEKKDLELAA